VVIAEYEWTSTGGGQSGPLRHLFFLGRKRGSCEAFDNKGHEIGHLDRQVRWLVYMVFVLHRPRLVADLAAPRLCG
jgi:hypothetical protein